MGSPNDHTLPNSNSPALHLAHPTDAEKLSIWKLSANSWKEALSESDYLKESSYLMAVPLAKDGGVTQWVLVDKSLLPDQRPILASCETFRKRSWISTYEDSSSRLTETITHGVASVYCDPIYRGRGYASRLMKELAKVLPTWQTKTTKCVASVLFSDIGKDFYTELGWRAFPSYHIEFAPLAGLSSRTATKPILASDLAQLCIEDEELSRKAMISPDSGSSNDRKVKFMIVPDQDHMFWHHSKEEFMAEALFENTPKIKGAITGEPGNRIWAVWTHRFYEPPGEKSSHNVLYILRLVVENQSGLDDLSQIEQLKEIISAAQAEAAEWNLHHVKIWDPSPQIQRIIKCIGIPFREEYRQKEGICSLLWYGPGCGTEDSLEWVSKEKYGWC